MKEVYLYQKLDNDKIKCLNCAHYCQILPGKRGICGVRENQKGKLCTLNYGKVAAFNVDPIEKKPFFHFLPGSQSLSLAAVGCNLKCANCQNWEISQMPNLEGKIEGKETRPKEIIDLALKENLPSISYTYTEPAIFSEFALDTMKLAREKGLKNNWVSNGFWSKELFDLISPYLDAANIDLKGFTEEFYNKYCGAKLQPVLDTLKRLKKKNIWTEITTLVIPTINDSEETFRDIASFIKKLGTETPWHISQFSGAISWKLKDLPETSIETLETAYKIGKEASLKYVYTGNVPGLPSEDTFCPKCNNLVIERTGYIVTRYDKSGKCPKCGQNLNLILK
ncbi:MAG: AmmeMemoRadiSam system radical SAM enzyme [bacterium]|nr:AmmeMemoRadiSam system radical SAM enzyme [bacterium]